MPILDLALIHMQMPLYSDCLLAEMKKAFYLSNFDLSFSYCVFVFVSVCVYDVCKCISVLVHLMCVHVHA